MANTDSSVPLPTWAQVQADPKNLGSVVATNLDARVTESYTRMAQFNCLQNAADNFALYLQGMRQGGRIYRFRMNLIQGVIISNAAIQVGDKPTFNLVPRESGEKPVCLINPEMVAQPDANGMRYEPGSMMDQLLKSLRPETWDKTNPEFLKPLNDDESKIVKMYEQTSQTMRMQAQAAGQPEPEGILPDGFYIELDDTEITDAMQALLDVKLEEGGFLQILIENCVYNSVFGWQCLLPEFDTTTMQPVFTNPYFSTVHIDPNKTDIKRCQWAIVDEFLDADEACMLFPDIKEQIRQKATMGPPVQPGSMPYLAPMPWFQSFMGRKCIIVRNAWIRNQEFPVGPMDEQEAIDAGLVIAKEIPNGTETNLPSSPGNGIAPDEPGSQNTPAQPGADVATPAPVRTFTLAKTGEPVTVDHPNWPQMTRLGLREIRVIAGQLVYDRESKRVNIPLGHNVDIPIPYTPYGQGEPERLEPLQRAYNSTLTDIVEHGDAVTFAPKLVSRELAQDNPQLLRIGLNDPRQFYPVDGRILAQGVDKIMGTYKPPDMPPDTWRREAILFDKFQYESDQSAVSRGQLPSSSTLSGNAIANLQGAAKTAIDFKGVRLQMMVDYVLKIVIGDLLEYMTPEDCAKVVRKFPVALWQYIHPMAKRLDFNFSIKVGKGDSKAQTIVNAANTPIGQAAISPQSFLEALQMDPDKEQHQKMQWQKNEAVQQQAQAPMQPPGAQQQQPPQQVEAY